MIGPQSSSRSHRPAVVEHVGDPQSTSDGRATTLPRADGRRGLGYGTSVNATDPDRAALETVLAGHGEYELFACDPALADTAAFCAAYGFSAGDSANTIVVVARRRGWFGRARRHPIRTAAILVPALALALPIGWYLASPLVLSASIDEPPPAFAAASEAASVAPRSVEPTATAAAAAASAAPATPVARSSATTPT